MRKRQRRGAGHAQVTAPIAHRRAVLYVAIVARNRGADDLANREIKAMRMPPLGRRAGMLPVVPALVAVAGCALLATAPSSAGDALATRSGEPQIAALRDPALVVTDASHSDAVAHLAAAAGRPPAEGAAARTWNVGAHEVVGYSSAGGSFCFAFSGGAGGCLEPGTLTDERPLDVMTDYGPGIFNVYGLALDGVTAVAVRLGGRERPAALAHNAFALSEPDLGGTVAVEGEVTATMIDGTTRSVPFRIGSLEIAAERLP